MSIFKIDLGAQVEDIISSFKGTITARAQYFNGCIRYQVNNKAIKSDEQKEFWFDEAQLKILKSKKLEPLNKTEPRRITGGPVSKYHP